jgi:hypothetical protein
VYPDQTSGRCDDSILRGGNMRIMRYRVIFILLSILILLGATRTNSYSEYLSQNELLVGKDTKYNSNVYIRRDSIVNHKNYTKTAIYCINIDKITEEYTADYNCTDKTIHIFKVTIKESDKILEQKDLYINEKVTKNTMDAKLLDAVCKFDN